MKNERLISAITWISKFHDNALVTGIEFEDGSGNNFNYTINGGPWRFITWETICSGLGYNPDNLLTTNSLTTN